PLASLVAGDLLVRPLVEAGLDVGDDVVDLRHADLSLRARFVEGGAQLVAVEFLAGPVALHHIERHVLDVLVGRVAAAALEALATAPDELAVPPHARVHHPVFRVAAERALHRTPPFTSRGRGREKTGSSARGPRGGPGLGLRCCRDAW